MTFMECIVRMFRTQAIIRGDTDSPATFSDTQHGASMQVARIAVQNELIRLMAIRLLPKERKTSGAITTVAATAEYDLASDFLRFFGEAHLTDHSNNLEICEYGGGLEKLQIDDIDYATTPGTPNWFYFSPQNSTYKKIGLYFVPQDVRSLVYDYEASLLISNESDALPFHNDEESFTFSDIAARRFKFMFEDVDGKADIQAILDKDQSYRTSTTTLYQLFRGTNNKGVYGTVYG